jgi:hypothetical protein
VCVLSLIDLALRNTKRNYLFWYLRVDLAFIISTNRFYLSVLARGLNFLAHQRKGENERTPTFVHLFPLSLSLFLSLSPPHSLSLSLSLPLFLSFFLFISLSLSLFFSLSLSRHKRRKKERKGVNFVCDSIFYSCRVLAAFSFYLLIWDSFAAWKTFTPAIVLWRALVKIK